MDGKRETMGDKTRGLAAILVVSMFAATGCGDWWDRTFGARQSCGYEGVAPCTTSSPACDEGLETDYSGYAPPCVEEGTAKQRTP